MIDKLLDYKERVGSILSRSELSKVFSAKVYEQAIGFLRIPEGTNILDKTSIHPESYSIAQELLKKYNLTEEDIGTPKIKEVLKDIDIEKVSKELNTDIYTLEDITKSLILPLRDPRDELDAPILKSDILTLDDLRVGMELEGTVRNVIDFGAFIDIGLKNDALVHISEITDKYIKHPSEILSVGEIVKCYVLNIDKDKKRVSLTLKHNNNQVIAHF